MKTLLPGHNHMHGLRVYRKIIISLIGLSSMTLLLTGCLVENKDPPPILDRDPSNLLRMIQSGDRIVYSLAGTRTTSFVPTSVSGTMTVTWTDDQIVDPHNAPSLINVLREESVVVFNQGGGNTFIRYITQEPNGSILVHKYYNQPLKAYMGTVLSPTYQPVQAVTSPMEMADGGYSYRIQECLDNVATCVEPSIKIISELIEYRGEVDLIISAGRGYNTLFYSFTGEYLQDNGVLESPLDFRTLCDANAIRYDGEYYYFPEVGLVEFFSSCTGTNATANPVGHSIRGSLLNASFPLP